MIKRLKTLPEEDFIFRIDYWVLLTSIFFLRLHNAFGYRYYLNWRIIGLMPVIFGAVINIHYLIIHCIKTRIHKKIAIIFGLYLVLIFQATVRTAFRNLDVSMFYFMGDFLILASMIVFLFSTFWIAQGDEKRFVLGKGLVYAFGIHVGMNIVFYLFGIDPRESMYLTQYPAQMLSLIGLNIDRVLFPMAEGINNFGLLSGASLVGLVLLNKFLKTFPETLCNYY